MATTGKFNTIPNIICIGCSYTYRLLDVDRDCYDKLIEELNFRYEDNYEILTSYKDLDMDKYFVIKLTEEETYNISKLFNLISLLGELEFCGFCCNECITDITINNDCVMVDIDTESG